MTLQPKILDWYIFKKFMLTFVIALVLIIGIVIVFDISEKIDKFVANQAPLKAIIVDYYMNFIPFFVNMYSAMFVFISVIFFTSRMAANSEIIAILSGGISFHRMMVPYIVASAIIALVSPVTAAAASECFVLRMRVMRLLKPCNHHCDFHEHFVENL